jgi:hypothetical protein
MPWSGGCETAWQVAAGVPEATAAANPAIYHQFD